MLMVAEEGISDTDPRTYKQAMNHIDKHTWQEACAMEVESLQENKAYSIVDTPRNTTIITSKWVFKKKKGLSCKVEKYKARVVAKGYMQEEGLAFGETYPPTVKQENIRLMMAMAASNGWHMEQMDVTTSFLYADLVEEIYLEIPEGMFPESAGMEGKVLRLWKALYGLKLSPRM